MIGPAVVLLFAVLVASITALYFKRKRFADAVNRIPGPAPFPIIGNVFEIWEKHNFNFADSVMAWNKPYSGFFRVWIGSEAFVVLSQPEDLEILMSSPTHITKSSIYSMLHDWIGLGLLTTTGKKWRERRKLITPTFHFNILDQFVDVFNKNGDILVKSLLSKNCEVVDIQHFIHLYTLDVICETAMGTSVDAQRNADASYVQAVYKACFGMNHRSVRPWLNSSFAFKLSQAGREFYSAIEILHKYSRQVIKSREMERQEKSRNSTSLGQNNEDQDTGIKKRSALLDHLLEARENGFSLSDDDIQEEVDTFMFEGHDTTSAGISYGLFNIAANREVQDKLVQEQHEIFGDSDRPPTTQDFQKMNYLDRVLKESLRLYPSVPIFARRIVSKDLELTDGKVIPVGCNVTIGCHAMHLDPDIWTDPLKFDPDRFLPENCSSRHPFAYIPFSAGPRNCVGQKFAMLEMKSAISKVLRNFEVSLPWPDYQPEAKGIVVLRSQSGVLLRLSKRV